jgi:hypothetical protein
MCTYLMPLNHALFASQESIYHLHHSIDAT